MDPGSFPLINGNLRDIYDKKIPQRKSGRPDVRRPCHVPTLPSFQSKLVAWRAQHDLVLWWFHGILWWFSGILWWFHGILGWFVVGFYGGLMGFNGIYPLVNVCKTMENHHFLWVNQLLMSHVQ